MSISSATRNLKFMRNAQARNPSTSTAPVIERKSAGDVAKSGTCATTSSATPSKALEAEREAQWELPPTPIASSSRRKAARPAVQVSTVQSYLPFMGSSSFRNDASDDDDDDDRGEGSSTGGMSGRMTFGAVKRRKVSARSQCSDHARASLTCVCRSQSKSPEADSSRSTERAKPKRDSSVVEPQSKAPVARKLDANGFAKPAGFDDLPTPSQRSKNSKRKDRESDDTPDASATSRGSAPDGDNADDDDDMLLQGARAKKTKKRKNKKQHSQTPSAPIKPEDTADSDDEADRFMEEMMAELRDD